MTLKQLLVKVTNKDKFKTLQNYIDFCIEYLEFIDNGNLQAIIVSQNENHYRFYQYKKEGNFNVSRPINSKLMYNSKTFDEAKKKFRSILKDIDSNSNDEFRKILNNSVYTIQQSIGATLDALPNRPNTARKIAGDLFERLIRIILSDLGIDCKSEVVKIPVVINGQEAFKMSYQHDLIIKNSSDVLKAFGSVKTSSKDRLDKIFIDKFLYSKLTDSSIPHFAIFLNDVQRKVRRGDGKYGISATFLPGHFKGYTIKLNPLDGVYYCDIRPNMLIEDILKDYIKTLDKLLFDDIWIMLK